MRFRGWIAPAAVGRIYDAISAVVVPARWPEPFGMTGIEAMRRGRAVIGAAHGGIPEWLVPGRAGALFTPGSPEELASYHSVCQQMTGRRDVFLAAMRNLHPVIDSGHCVPIALPSEQAAELLGPMLRERDGADLIVLDGGHDYPSVARDIRIWEKLVAEGGQLCGHDYKPDFPGVIQATSELLGQVEIVVGSIWRKRL